MFIILIEIIIIFLFCSANIKEHSVTFLLLNLTKKAKCHQHTLFYPVDILFSTVLPSFLSQFPI